MTIKTFLPIPPRLRNQPKNGALLIQERRLAALKYRKMGKSIASIGKLLNTSDAMGD